MKESFGPFPDIVPDSISQLDAWLQFTQITPLRAHEHRCLNCWTIEERTLNDCLWFYVDEGKGHFWAGNKSRRYDFSPGDLILIPPSVPHAVYKEQKSILYQTSVHFHAKLFGVINLLDLLVFPLRVPACPDAPFKTVSAELAREYALRTPGWKNAMADGIMRVLLFIIRHYGSQFRPSQAWNLNRIMPRLLEVLTTLDRQVNNPELTVTQLARQAACSTEYLRKIFNRVTGLSPVLFIQRRRIELACQHLRCSHMSVKEIAEQTGFSDLPFFYRVFKRWTNTTPALYRAEYESCLISRTFASKAGSRRNGEPWPS